jgi:hypothetical protein
MAATARYPSPSAKPPAPLPAVGVSLLQLCPPSIRNGVRQSLFRRGSVAQRQPRLRSVEQTSGLWST